MICQAKEEELNEAQAAIVRELAKTRDRLCRIPAEEYREYAELIAGAAQVWARAKRENDFASFAPVLTRIIEMSKKIADYSRKEGQSRYDAMLWQYEEGFGQDVLDPFFALFHIADNAFQLLLHLSDFYVHRIGDDILDFIKILCRPAHNSVNQLHAFPTDFFAERPSYLFLCIFHGFFRYFKSASDDGSRNHGNNRERIQEAQYS